MSEAHTEWRRTRGTVLGKGAVMIYYVALGSAVGGVTRFLLSSLIQARLPSAFPLGTFVINVTGSFLVAFLMRYALATPAVSAEVRALLTTGFCGGYTTFSTFSYEAVKLGQDGDYRTAGWYIAGSVVVALLGALGGTALADAMLAIRRSR